MFVTLRSVPSAEVVPVLYDHYEIERLLGRGGAGAVYLARDVRINRRVALKTINDREADEKSDTATFERFRREAEVCGALVHPNIVTLYEVGFEGKHVRFLAMEYVDGETLLALIRRYDVIPVDHAIRIIDDLLQGLAYAHERGVIHRDVKPANVLISTDGTAKLTDFGIATSMTRVVSELTGRDQILGTPHYMSPEAVMGRPLDSRSDLYSLGVVAWEMLAARKPLDGESVSEVLYKVVNEPAAPLQSVAPDAPQWYAAFVDRLLEKDPRNRFLSAATASREWRRLADDYVKSRHEPKPKVLAASITPTTSLRRPKLRWLTRRIPTATGVAIVATVAFAATTAIVLIQQQIHEAPEAVVQPDRARFEQRKQLFTEAAALAEAGAWKQARERYELLLADQPGSAAAREGLARVEQAEKTMKRRNGGGSSQREIEVTASGEVPDDYVAPQAAKREATARPEKASEQRSVGSRIKRFFTRRK